MVYTHKWKNQQKRQFIHLNENLNDFVIGGNANIVLVGDEAMESQADGHYNYPDRNVRSVAGKITACQNQVEGNKIEARIRKRLTMQSRPSKIACMTLFRQQWTMWLLHEMSWP